MRLFNRYITSYDFALIFGDLLVAFVSTVVVRFMALQVGMSTNADVTITEARDDVSQLEINGTSFSSYCLFVF